MHSAAGRLAVVGTDRSNEPFPFTSYAAIASARDHLGPVVVLAPHLPYGVWWDRLRPTIDLIRRGEASRNQLPLDGIWCEDGRFIPAAEDGYAGAAAAYRASGDLF